MAEIALRCQDLTKHFGPVRAVNQVELTLTRGSFLALLGPSGCGKTTTLRLIAGFERPDAGSIEIGGRRVVGPHVWVPPERRRVGMVFQDYALFPHLTVAENVAYGIARKNGREQRVAGLLSLVGLEGLHDRLPHELSGGQQQRVALARALAPEPDVLLLDEPFSNLDASLRAHVRAEVRSILRAAGATAVFVTHDQEEALSLADEVAVVWAGHVVQVASPEELYRHPTTREVAAFVGDANFLPGEARSGQVSCELGTFPVSSAPDGSVDLLLRPEYVLPVPDQDGPGKIVAREFYGHDQKFLIQLDSGTTLYSFVGARREESDLRPGRRVRVKVEGEALAFPVASNQWSDVSGQSNHPDH